MKKTLQSLLSLTLIAFCITTFAQGTSNLEVFSENGETFTLSVNGKKINNTPESNVKATGLTGEFQMVSVQFSDASKAAVSQNVMIEPGMEQRAVIKLAKKGYVLRPFGEPVVIGSAPAPMPAENRPPAPAPAPAITENRPPAPAPAPQRTPQTRQIEAVQQPVAQTTTVTTTTTTVSDEGQVKMDLGAGDMKVGIDVKIVDGGLGTATTVRSTETTTVTTTVAEPQPTRTLPAERRKEPTPAVETVVREVPACGPMAGGDFAEAKRTISSSSFEDSKMTTAKQVIKSSCMSTDQIKDVMGLFSFEESKLTFAKAAYDRCSDKQNFWKLNDSFTFESSIDDLNNYIEKK
jgi:hypothetical protein